MSNAPFLELFKLPQTTIENHSSVPACIEIQFLQKVGVTLWIRELDKFVRLKEACVTTHHCKEEYEVEGLHVRRRHTLNPLWKIEVRKMESGRRDECENRRHQTRKGKTSPRQIIIVL
jgi:hypothetical protein